MTTRRLAVARARLLAAALVWERDAEAEEERMGVAGEIGIGRAPLFRRIAAGLRNLAEMRP